MVCEYALSWTDTDAIFSIHLLQPNNDFVFAISIYWPELRWTQILLFWDWIAEVVVARWNCGLTHHTSLTLFNKILFINIFYVWRIIAQHHLAVVDYLDFIVAFMRHCSSHLVEPCHTITIAPSWRWIVIVVRSMRLFRTNNAWSRKVFSARQRSNAASQPHIVAARKQLCVCVCVRCDPIDG